MAQSSKAEAMKALMRRPETVKLIQDAVKSPLGSTSRMKAKKIFSIMKKLHKGYPDAQGGPGMMAEQDRMYNEPPVVADNSMKKMVIFHRIPKAKIVYGGRKQKADGRGGIGYDGRGGFFDQFGAGRTTSAFSTTPTAKFAMPQLSPGGTMPMPTPASTYNLSGLTSYMQSPLSAPASTTRPSSLDFGVTLSPSGTLALPSTPKSPLITQRGGGFTEPTKPSGTIQAPSPVDGGFILPGLKTPLSSAPIQQVPQAPSVPSAPTTEQPRPTTEDGATKANTASVNVAKILNVSPQTPLSVIKIEDLSRAIATNEGYFNGTSTIAIANNNPGNLKFIGQTNAMPGGAASDGGTYAKFSTIKDGWDALQQDLYSKIKSGKYATLSDLMAVYSPDAGAPMPYSYPESRLAAKEAVERGMGASQFAFQQTEEARQKEYDDRWKEFNIGGLMTKLDDLKKESIELPPDMIGYIKTRDVGLKQTDEAIAKIVSNIGNMDATERQAANAQLNYLYVMRGRINKTYTEYLYDAIDKNKADIENTTNQLNTAITGFNQAQTITKDKYDRMAAAYADMYDAIEAAPTKAYQLEAYRQQVLGTSASTIADLVKQDSQIGYIAQSNKLEGYIWDSSHLVMPNVDLVETIQELSVLEPSIQHQNIYKTYVDGVRNYMNTPNDTDPTDSTGTGITDDTKIKTAEWAIKQFAQVALMGDATGDSNAVTLGMTDAYNIVNMLGNKVSEKIMPRITQLQSAIRTLAPRGWFGAKAAPSIDTFVKTATADSSTPLDVSIAEAIYAVFQRYTADDGNKATSPGDALIALFNMTNSTEDLANLQPLSEQDLAQRIGMIYASGVLQDELAQNEKLSMQIKMQLGQLLNSDAQ